MSNIKLTESQESIIREKYLYWAFKNVEEGTQSFGEALGFECGVMFVLKELDIKLKGVNYDPADDL